MSALIAPKTGNINARALDKRKETEKDAPESGAGSKEKAAVEKEAAAGAPPAKKPKLILGGKSDSKQTPDNPTSAPASGNAASAKVPQSWGITTTIMSSKS